MRSKSENKKEEGAFVSIVVVSVIIGIICPPAGLGFLLVAGIAWLIGCIAKAAVCETADAIDRKLDIVSKKPVAPCKTPKIIKMNYSVERAAHLRKTAALAYMITCVYAKRRL